VIIFDN